MAKQEIIDKTPEARPKKKKDLVVKKKRNEMMALIDKAVTNNIPVEQLKELMQLKREYDQQQAEKIFNEKFSEFQQALPIIKKTRPVKTKKGALAYKYATLDDILRQVKPIFAKFKFAYKWSEESSTIQGHKKIVYHIRLGTFYILFYGPALGCWDRYELGGPARGYPQHIRKALYFLCYHRSHARG